MAPQTPASVAAFAESVELVAVAAYDRCLPLLSEPLASFQQHHRAHALLFRALAGNTASHRANASLAAALEPRLASLTDDRGALQFLVDLENQLAATYTVSLSQADDPDVARTLATILPVEAQHATYAATTLGLLGTNLFVNGSFEGTSVGDVSDSRRGFDATLYPVG